MARVDPFVGRVILGGEFKILERVGTGGMGSVYRAEQPSVSRQVAIKILHPHLARRPDLMSRFRREARAMSRLSHPNAVAVFMVGELVAERAPGPPRPAANTPSGVLYIVMEYLEGQTLSSWLQRAGRMPCQEALRLMRQVGGAVQEAHSKGVVHRDLKPENIFLCEHADLKLFPKVLDFGLAKFKETELRPGSLQLTQEGMVFGTPQFMSPEQAQGRTIDARSDQYALAVMLYELLTGQLPFNALTPADYLQKHVLEPPIPLNQRQADLTFPRPVEAALATALAKQPADRFESVAQFMAALEPAAPSPRLAPPPLAPPPLVPPPLVPPPLPDTAPAASAHTTTETATWPGSPVAAQLPYRLLFVVAAVFLFLGGAVTLFVSGLAAN